MYCTLYIACYFTGTLISHWPDQEGNKLMFLSEWLEFPFGPLHCRGKKIKELDDRSRPDVVEITRVRDMLPSLFPSW
jgi:hypothetical protein